LISFHNDFTFIYVSHKTVSHAKMMLTVFHFGEWRILCLQCKWRKQTSFNATDYWTCWCTKKIRCRWNQERKLHR